MRHGKRGNTSTFLYVFDPFSFHVLARSRTLAVLALWAARGSAPLCGGRCRSHPLTACAHSGILVAGTGRRTGFCRSEQRTASAMVRDMVVFLLV
jgi:hypothetical protein